MNAHDCTETDPIGDCDVGPVAKQWVKRHGHSSSKQVQDLAEDGWVLVDMHYVGKSYKNMPIRWNKILNADRRRIDC